MDKPRRRRVSRRFPFALLLAGVVLTLFATFYVREVLYVQRHLEFETQAEQARMAINNRIGSQTALLRGAAAFFAAQTNVTRETFHAFVARLRLQTNYPGVQGLGFAARVSPSEIKPLTDDLHRQDETDFRVRPESPARDEYFPIVYLEPHDVRNTSAIGFDMFSDPVRREAMERARDTGLPAACGKVLLVQEIFTEKQAGFLIYIPIFVGGPVPDSVEERRRLLKGFVYSPFRVDDFLENVWASSPMDGLSIRIYDGEGKQQEQLLYDEGPGPDGLGSWFNPRQHIDLTNDVAGRSWTLQLAEAPERNAARWVPCLIFLGGLGLSVTFFLLSLAQARARRAAEESAQRLLESEEALRQSENQLRLIIESAQDYAIFSSDLKNQIISWNSGAERMFGYTESEAIGRSGDIIFTPEDRGQRVPEAEIERAIHLGMARDDRWHQRKDGTRLYVSGVVRPMRDHSGKRVGFTKIARDITERLLAEEKLHREKEFSDMIINSLPAVFYLFDQYGKWLRWNDNGLTVTGYTAEELQMQAPWNLFSAADSKRVLETIQKVLKEGQGIVEASIVSKTGRSTPYLLFGRRIILENTLCVMGMGVDISDRTRVELELRDAEERLRNYTVELEHRVADRTAHLRQSLASLEGLLYHVAHDLRAPLRAMASFTTILEEEYSNKLDQRGHDYTARIASSARFMDELLQDLLAYGRLAHTPVALHSINLESVVDAVLEQLQPDVESKRAVVQVQRPLPSVKANTSVLNQILLNLITNALKFSLLDKPPHVRIGATRGKVVRFWVEDEGIGIKPEYHERIFRVFERLHGGRDYPGTGIGLAIVQKGVERMGGRAGLESEFGKGSCFWVELPSPDETEGNPHNV